MLFNEQPAKDIFELAGEFSVPLLLQASKIANNVDVRPGLALEYAADFGDYTAFYDGVMVPGSSRCNCPDFHSSKYCVHIAALALLVLGRGHLPEDLHRLQKFSEYPDNSTDAQFDQQLAELVNQLRTCEQGVGPYLQTMSEVTQEFSELAKLGHGQALVEPLCTALSIAQERIQFLRHKFPRQTQRPDFAPSSWTSPLMEAAYYLSDVLVEVKEVSSGSLLGWAKEIIQAEQPNEEFLLTQHLTSILDTSELEELVDWITSTQDSTDLVTWGRLYALNNELGRKDVAFESLYDAPISASRLVIYQLSAFPFDERAKTVVKRLIKEDYLSFDPYNHGKVYIGDLSGWMSESNDSEAKKLLRALVLKYFNIDFPINSARVTRDAFQSSAVVPRIHKIIDSQVAGASHMQRAEGNAAVAHAAIECFYAESGTQKNFINAEQAAYADSDVLQVAEFALSEVEPATVFEIKIAQVLQQLVSPFAFAHEIRQRIRELERHCEKQDNRLSYLSKSEAFLEDFSKRDDLPDQLVDLLGQGGYLRGGRRVQWLQEQRVQELREMPSFAEFLPALGFPPSWEDSFNLIVELGQARALQYEDHPGFESIRVYSDPSGTNLCFIDSGDGLPLTTMTVARWGDYSAVLWQVLPGLAHVDIYGDDGSFITRILAYVDEPHLSPLYDMRDGDLNDADAPTTLKNFRLGAIAVDVTVYESEAAWEKEQEPIGDSGMLLGPRFIASPWLFSLYDGTDAPD